MMTMDDRSHSDPNQQPYGFHETCVECQVEAWERMTTGGMVIEFGATNSLRPICPQVQLHTPDGFPPAYWPLCFSR